MVHLFIQAEALKLRDTRMTARVFPPSIHCDEYCMPVIDTGGTNLPEKYNGVLDNYLESGHEVSMSHQPAATPGKSKCRKHDKPA